MQATETPLPPLYAPIVSKFRTISGKLIKRFVSSFEPPIDEHPKGALSQTYRENFEYVGSLLKKPLSLLSSSFVDNSAVPRWRPLVVLIHLCTTGRPQLRTLFTGFCEAALLLALTFFFAAQWGGTLYITAIALALLLLFISIGRALAITYGKSRNTPQPYILITNTII